MKIQCHLLEVVGEDFFELAQPLGRDAFQPAHEALVEIRAQLLRNRLVGSVADQRMSEGVAVVTRNLRATGTNELLARERQQMRADIGPHVLGCELDDRSPVEEPALDRGTLDDDPLGRREGVDARCKQRLEARRDVELARAVALCPQGDDLLDEERISLRDVEDPAASLRVEVRDEVSGFVRREGPQDERCDVRPWRGPGRPGVQQVGARGAEQQDRRGREIHDVLDEVEERRLGPVQIVQHDDERSLAGERLEQLPGRPRYVPAVDGASAGERVDEPRRRLLAVLLAVEHGVDRSADLFAGHLPHDVGERQVGRPVGVGDATAGEDARLTRDRRDELGRGGGSCRPLARRPRPRAGRRPRTPTGAPRGRAARARRAGPRAPASGRRGIADAPSTSSSSR